MHYICQLVKKCIKLILKEIKETKAIDISTLEDSVEDFHKAYEKYGTIKSSKELLSDAQQRLHDAQEFNKKINGHIENLQATFAKVEKEIEALIAKRKKTIALIDERTTSEVVQESRDHHHY